MHLEDLADPDEGRYRPSAQLDAFIRLRDPLCTGPGCSTSSRRSDLDHLDPWPHGPTTAGNLRPKSRRCHRAKTHSWTVTDSADGSSKWHSPTGRTYTVPPTWTPPPEPRPRPGRDPKTPTAAPTSTAEPDTDTDLTRDLDADLDTRLDTEQATGQAAADRAEPRTSAPTSRPDPWSATTHDTSGPGEDLPF